jgi:hypothetical protein
MKEITLSIADAEWPYFVEKDEYILSMFPQQPKKTL